MKVGAVILAAGFGTRLAPLTDHTPKPLLVVGEQPVASHLIDQLRAVRDLDQVIVVVNDQHLGQWNAWQQSLVQPPTVRVVSNGVTNETSRQGAVADMAQAIAAVDDVDWIVVLAGDNLIDESLQRHVDTAVAEQHPVVLCRDLGEAVPSGRFGEITADPHGVITRFREKPEHPKSPLAATCSYVLPGDIGQQLAIYLTEGDADSPGSFVGWLAELRPVIARALTGRYFDIGNHETLATARAAYHTA